MEFKVDGKRLVVFLDGRNGDVLDITHPETYQVLCGCAHAWIACNEALDIAQEIGCEYTAQEWEYIKKEVQQVIHVVERYSELMKEYKTTKLCIVGADFRTIREGILDVGRFITVDCRHPRNAWVPMGLQGKKVKFYGCVGCGMIKAVSKIR